MSLQGMKRLARELIKDNSKPMFNFEVGIFYQYFTAEEDIFSKNFVFCVVEDNHDHYIIDVEKQYKTPLHKTFDLLEAVNAGKIIRLGIL